MPPIDERLKQIIREVCEEHQAETEALEVMPAHVHLLVNVDPQFGIHRLMQLVKGHSSSFFAPGISWAKSEIADLVDELVFG